MRNRFVTLALLAICAGGLAACGEDLNGTAGCPSLCPEQNVVSRDTVLESFVEVDTTVIGYPSIGTEGFLLVASRGDTLDARAIIRFDSLTQSFTHGGEDSTIYAIDSARVRVILDTTGTRATAPVTVELYDVDTTAVDSSTAAVLALFRPDRLIGGRTYEPSEIKDTLDIPVNNVEVLTRLTGEAPRRLRVGVRVQSTASAQLRVVARESGETPLLSYRVSPDTAVAPIVNNAFSSTPTNNSTLRSDLTDYQVVAFSNEGGAGQRLAIGGVPSRRAYLRFDLPTALVDSTTIVRATLLLTQVPSSSVDAADTVTVYPQVVRAAVGLGDVGRAAGILNPPGLEMDSLRVPPGVGGTRTVEMVGAFREWQAIGPNTLQRAIVLRTATEGASGAIVQFYSSEADPGLRPRLRITYVNKVDFGVP